MIHTIKIPQPERLKYEPGGFESPVCCPVRGALWTALNQNGFQVHQVQLYYIEQTLYGERIAVPESIFDAIDRDCPFQFNIEVERGRILRFSEAQRLSPARQKQQ